jgi:hypothetical protein
MRTPLLALLTTATLAAWATAAPAPLPRRHAPVSATDLEAARKEIARYNQEQRGRGLLLLGVRRGDEANEWVVTYLPQAEGRAFARKCELDTAELRFVAGRPEQFAQALRAHLFAQQWEGLEKCK